MNELDITLIKMNINELLRVDYVIVIDSGAPRAWTPIANKIWLLIHEILVVT